MFTLKRLVAAAPAAKFLNEGDFKIEGLAHDSRLVRENFCFICLNGAKENGHRFIVDAIQRGARAIVGDDPAALKSVPREIATILVPDSRRALAQLACEF